jgi:hypothetical protein
MNYRMKFLLAILSLLATGIGTMGQSNNPLTTKIDTLMHEEFNVPAKKLPAGWTINDTMVPWTVNNSHEAGGEPNELLLYYSFAFGTIRMNSPVISVGGYKELCLRYKQYLVNADLDWGEVIGLDVTFDQGGTWQNLWQKAIGTIDIPQDEFSYYFTVPEGATEMQFSYRFEGNTFAINFWAVDDIVLETVPDNDLRISILDGTSTPSANSENDYKVTVTNGGKLTADNYKVKLFDVDGTELVSVAGRSTAFSVSNTYTLKWRPAMADTGSTKIYAAIEFNADEYTESNQTPNLFVTVLPESIVPKVLDEGKVALNALPMYFFNLYSLAQTIYFPDEIGMVGKPITGIVYTNHFDYDVNDVDMQVMIGETEKNDLSEGWIDPATLTPVYDGKITFYRGFNQTFIAFDSAYTYTGKNLVLYTNKGYSEQVFSAPFMSAIDTNSYRSRTATADDAPFDILHPSEFSYTLDYYPNITVFYDTNTVGINDGKPQLVSINLYPNPASTLLHIYSTQTIKFIKLDNIAGQTVCQFSGSGNLSVVNVESMQSGIYLLRVITSNGQTIKKLQITH